MDPLDVLIDDYLRAIIQARPWAKRREEEALRRLSEWVEAQGADVAADLAIGGAALAIRCGTDLNLDPAAREQLRTAVWNLARWARAEAHLSAPLPTLR